MTGRAEMTSNWLQVPQFTVSTVPDPASFMAIAGKTDEGLIIFVSDETGGATLAFYDGTNWRRVTDNAVVS